MLPRYWFPLIPDLLPDIPVLSRTSFKTFRFDQTGAREQRYIVTVMVLEATDLGYGEIDWVQDVRA